VKLCIWITVLWITHRGKMEHVVLDLGSYLKLDLIHPALSTPRQLIGIESGTIVN
jgi:hypothetical protein